MDHKVYTEKGAGTGRTITHWPSGRVADLEAVQGKVIASEKDLGAA